MAEKNETGKIGEETACSFLRINGYTILETNWRYRHYELDIIASDGNELVVVEVKTRSETYRVAPEDTVSRKKIQRIVAAADAYILHKNISLPVRFDIICMVRQGISYVVERHIEDAFFAPVNYR
ncbi:MAG: YraN family protein [Tannerella sp.]|jgi:putative endonuclease|nr:YraN family protein [Tannerella sp.]